MKHISTFDSFLNEDSINEKAKWESRNLTMDFYNLWASLDVACSNLSHYMDDMHKGNEQDALFSLKVAFDELQDLLKTKQIEKQLKPIEQELKDKNVLR